MIDADLVRVAFTGKNEQIRKFHLQRTLFNGIYRVPLSGNHVISGDTLYVCGNSIINIIAKNRIKFEVLV